MAMPGVRSEVPNCVMTIKKLPLVRVTGVGKIALVHPKPTGVIVVVESEVPGKPPTSL
jgi:hypothetical protein